MVVNRFFVVLGSLSRWVVVKMEVTGKVKVKVNELGKGLEGDGGCRVEVRGERVVDGGGSVVIDGYVRGGLSVKLGGRWLS